MQCTGSADCGLEDGLEASSSEPYDHKLSIAFDEAASKRIIFRNANFAAPLPATSIIPTVTLVLKFLFTRHEPQERPCRCLHRARALYIYATKGAVPAVGAFIFCVGLA